MRASVSPDTETLLSVIATRPREWPARPAIGWAAALTRSPAGGGGTDLHLTLQDLRAPAGRELGHAAVDAGSRHSMCVSLGVQDRQLMGTTRRAGAITA